MHRARAACVLLCHFLLKNLSLTHMCHTLNNWRGASRAQKKRNRMVPKKGRAFTRWKENKNVGTGPFFIGSVSKWVHSRLWTFLGTERIKLEWVKYRLPVKFCLTRSSFYLSRSNFFGRVNGPLVTKIFKQNNVDFFWTKGNVQKFVHLSKLKSHWVWLFHCQTIFSMCMFGYYKGRTNVKFTNKQSFRFFSEK